MIDTILVNMLVALNTSTDSGQFAEYKLDTGQTKTEIKYTSLDELQRSYDAMFRTKQMVLAQLNANRQGRVFTLVSPRNFTGWPNGYGGIY